MKDQPFKYFNFMWPTSPSGLGFATVDKVPYENSYLFVYFDKKLSIKDFSKKAQNIIDKLSDYTEIIPSAEEAYSLLGDLSDEEKITYVQILAEHGINDYVIYGLINCHESKTLIDQFVSVMLDSKLKLADVFVPTANQFSDPNEKFLKNLMNFPTIEDKIKYKQSLVPHFNVHPEDNRDKMTLYIILRHDLSRTVQEQMCDTAILTAEIAKSPKFSEFAKSWDYQTVILTASYLDLFVNNFLPSDPSDSKLIFAKYIDSEEQVAPGNFRLAEAQINGVAYMGKKSDMPKYVRKLKTWSI